MYSRLHYCVVCGCARGCSERCRSGAEVQGCIAVGDVLGLGEDVVWVVLCAWIQ